MYSIALDDYLFAICACAGSQIQPKARVIDFVIFLWCFQNGPHLYKLPPCIVAVAVSGLTLGIAAVAAVAAAAEGF